MIFFIFTVLIRAVSTNALFREDSYNTTHRNHPFIQPRHASFSVKVDRTTVTIQTPNFDNPYPRRTLLRWHIEATREIDIYCPVFKLRHRKRRWCKDYLKVEDGGRIRKYCGKDLNRLRYISKANQILLTFKSGRKKNNKHVGFNCTITTIKPYCNCGIYTPPVINNKMEPSKIVGGQKTRRNQYPWQATLVRRGSKNLICGGSVINDQWVLTAAHCTDIHSEFGLKVNDFQILLGVQCFSRPAPGQIRLNPLSIVQHEEYNDFTIDNDIALIQLETSIDFIRTQFRPVCLPITEQELYVDVPAEISGLGTIKEGGRLPNCLQYANVTTMSNTVCNAFYNPDENVTENMICAGHKEGGIDSCQGDSGGPMVTNVLYHYYIQIGIVSWGIGCAHPNYPGVYTRVSRYLDWIAKNTAGSSTCPSPPIILNF